MASLMEMVEEEAAKAEAEGVEEEDAESEPEGEEEGEEEGEPEALGAIGPDEIRKAEKAREAQRRKLAGILGESYVAHECLFCSGLGFAPEPPPLGARFTIVEGEGGLGFEIEGPPPAIPLLEAPDKAMCDECDGWGEVLSGSKASHGMVTPCSKCSGNGWVMVARDAPLVPAFNPALPPSPTQSGPPAGTFGPDAWGRPHGHQHWGVPPANIPG